MIQLNEIDQDIIKGCIIAILEGPFLDDWEFQTRIGVERQKLKDILKAHPNFNKRSDNDTQMAINNCLNEIINGIRITDEEWNKWFLISRKEIEEAYSKWLQIHNSSQGVR